MSNATTAGVKTPDVLQRISDWLKNPKTSTGELAALRRMDPEQPEIAYPAIYQFLGENAHTAGPEHLARWALVIHCLALVRGQHQSGGRKLGAALVDINYGELRTQMLLRADFALQRDLYPRLARRLHANGGVTDWWPLANLVLHQESQKFREQIVRDYLSAESKVKAQKSA